MSLKQRLTGLSVTVAFLMFSVVLAACAPKATAQNTATGTPAVKPVTTGTATPMAVATTQAAATTAPVAAATATPADAAQKTFTKDQLATYDGQNGNPAYIAVNGVVYDVSNVKQWKTGRHEGYAAGKDLTDMIAQAPHGTSVLDGLPVVGKYVK